MCIHLHKVGPFGLLLRIGPESRIFLQTEFLVVILEYSNAGDFATIQVVIVLAMHAHCLHIRNVLSNVKNVTWYTYFFFSY